MALPALINPNAMKSTQAGPYIGVKAETLDNWRSQGRGPAFYRINGSAVRYRQADLDAYMESFRVSTKDAA